MKSKTTAILILAMLSVSIPSAFSGDTFEVDYHFDSFVLTESGPLIEGTFMHSIAGEPMVPYYPATILLPEGATVKDVKVKTGAPVVQKGFEFPWGQPPCTFSDTPVMVGPNEAIYGSDNDYPTTLFEVVSIGSFRGFQILNVNLFPVQYMPKSGTVKFYETMSVEVQFGKGLKNKLYRGLGGDKADVAGIVDNPETTSTYEEGGTPLATEEYIIITNDTMASTFQALADWKACFLTGPGVYTVSWITSNYTGVDNAEKIRNFIIDKYTNNGLKYVLLGGDIAAVPYRGFYIYSGGYSDYDMLADMYFAHLDGNWNNDGDSYWAEPGEEDWYAEIGVGRAPCENTTEAQNFVDKVIAYEQMDKPERACLHQARVQPSNNPDSRCLAWNCDDWLPGSYVKDYVFEEDVTITKDVWRTAWAANPLVVAHIGHGSSTSYQINYEIGGTVTWYCSDVSTFTNTFWPWTTSVACHSGNIETNDCLAECYVKDPDNGAIVAIYNDNYGWFSYGNACMYSGEFCEMEFRACWSDGYEKFGDMLNQARSYMVSSASSNSTYRWCFYERNIVGDPESPSLTKRVPCGTDTVTITYPTNGQTVTGPITVTTSTEGCIDTVEFYVDGVLKYTDTTAPFEYYFDPCALKEDENMTISVEGYCSGVSKDTDSVTVYVDCEGPPPYVTITYPTEGQEVSGTVICTADSNCDSVKWYIDGVFKEEDTGTFEYVWDTTAETNGGHTVKAEGYIGGVYECEDTVNCTVNNVTSYVTITYPSEGETVSGFVLITVDASPDVDTVEFYIEGKLKNTDTAAPFQYNWNSKSVKDGTRTIVVKGYSSSTFVDDDTVNVIVANKASIALLSLLVFFIPAGIFYKRR